MSIPTHFAILAHYSRLRQSHKTRAKTGAQRSKECIAGVRMNQNAERERGGGREREREGESSGP